MTEKIHIRYRDRLICDPYYIKSAIGNDENRWDLLRCEKVLCYGCDGLSRVKYNGIEKELHCDSGRIWQMISEFSGTVDIESKPNSYWLIRKEEVEDDKL